MSRKRRRGRQPVEAGAASTLTLDEAGQPGRSPANGDPVPEASDESTHDHVVGAFEQHKGKELEVRLQDFFWLKRQQWFQERAELFSRWRRQWDLYMNRGKLQRFVRGQGIQVYVPRAMILVETLAPRFGKAIFGADKWFTAEAMLRVDPEGTALTEALMYKNADDAKWKPRGNDWIKLGLIHGVGVLHVKLERRRVRVPVRNGVEEDILDNVGQVKGRRVRLQDVELEDRVEEMVVWRVLPSHSFFMGLKDGDPQRCSGGAGHEELVSYDELRELDAEGYYYGVDRLLKGLKSSKENAAPLPGLRQSRSGHWFGWDRAWWTWTYEQARDTAAGVSDFFWEPVKQKGNWDFVVAQFQAPVPLDGWDKSFVWCSVHMVGPYVIRCVENDNPLGRTDYHAVTSIPIPGYFNGQGVITPNESLIVEENEHRNLLLDASSLRVRPVTLVERGACIAAGIRLHEPGARLDLNYKGGIDWMPPPPNMQESEMQVSVLEDLMRSAAGVPVGMEGESSGPRATAAEVSTRQYEGNVRHVWGAEMMEIDGLKGALEHSLALLQMHLTQKQAVRVLGMQGWEWQEVSPEQIMGKYAIRIRSSTETANQSLSVQQAQNFASLAGNLAGISPEVLQAVNWLEVLKSVAEMMRTPGREHWFRERKRSTTTWWKEIASIREGHKPETSEDDDAIGFMAYINMPGPMDPQTGMPGPTLRDEFMGHPEIDPYNKALFEAFVRERSDLAAAQFFAAQGGGLGMAGLAGGMMPGQQAPGPPGALGGAPAPGWGGMGAPDGLPTGAAQEQPRSMEAIMRMQGNLPVSTPMHQQRFNGRQ